MSKVSEKLPQKELFNALFYVMVYLFVDLAHDKPAARKSYSWLKRHTSILEEVIDDISVFENRGIDAVEESGGKTFWRAYNKMFEDIVLEHNSKLQIKYDKWGAMYFYNPDNNESLLVGDAIDMYSIHDYDALKEYLSNNA